MRAPTGDKIAAGETILAVENVSLAFGGVKAITDVSFDIRKGEIRAIIGPNGAGKTSMLNVINGFYQPQQGRITFKGRTRSTMRPYDAARGGIARTFQNVALFKGMSALDNIIFPLKHKYGRVSAEEKDKARELLRIVGLTDFMQSMPDQLFRYTPQDLRGLFGIAGACYGSVFLIMHLRRRDTLHKPIGDP